MIELTYHTPGDAPSATEQIRSDANRADTLPSSFEVVAVRREATDAHPSYSGRTFTLLVDPPSDNISQNAVDAIAAAFSNRWGRDVSHVETNVVD